MREGLQCPDHGKRIQLRSGAAGMGVLIGKQRFDFDGPEFAVTGGDEFIEIAEWHAARSEAATSAAHFP